MFSKLSPIFKLSLCLLLSTGLHGALVFYDWMTPPVEPSSENVPVLVSLLPVTNVVTPVLTEKAELQPQQFAPSKAVPAKTSPVKTSPAKAVPHTVKAQQPSAAKRTATVPPKVVAAKPLLKKPPVAVVVDEPRMKIASAEMVCMTPQDVLFDSHPVLFTDNNPEVAPARVETTTDNLSTRTQQVSLHADDKSVLDLSSVAMIQSLVEAVPNYRSNPLPEYPFLARQKHWEGVVWLLVDITAEGLVDDLQVEQPCGHRVLDRAASRTVRRWQFSPATRAGVPVASQVRVPVRFRLEDG